MKTIFLSSFCFLLSLALPAQNWNHYQPLQAKGPVPADFTEVYYDKYQKGLVNISSEDSRKTRRRKDDFYRKSEYFVNEYLVSGKVFFGDTITNYCRRVLDQLIGEDEALKKEIRLYTVKSPIVNAAATGSGIIFVNLGLLAHLETEAQLAYILAHELTHYTENHVIDQYIEQERIVNGESVYRRSSDDDKMVALSTYSKTQEMEADLIGYKRYFSRLPYKKLAPYEVMDVLRYAALPFENHPFPENFFETRNLKFPDNYHLSEVSSVEGYIGDDEENRTHPNLENRKKALKSVVKGQDGDDFIMSEQAFHHCQKLARFELSRLYLLERNYPQAIYNSFLLLRNDTNNYYLKLSIAKALQALQVYHNEADLYDIVKTEGASQELYHFFNEIKRDELSVLAVSWAYELKKDYPEDKAIQRIFKKTLWQMLEVNSLKREDFYTIHDTITSNTNSNNVVPENFHLYAFVDYFKEEAFNLTFEKLEKRNKNSEEDYDDQRYEKRDKFDHNVALNIPRVICVTPQYLKLDQRDEDGIKFISTDERLIRYREYIHEIARMVNLDLMMLDYKGDREFDAQQFNDIALITSWLRERMNHVNHDVLNSDFNYTDNLIERYHTPYFINTGNVSLRIKENFINPIIGAIVFPPLLPFSIMDLATEDYQSFNYFFAFDLRNGDAVLAEYNYYESSDARDYIRSILYNNLMQISDQPKANSQ